MLILSQFLYFSFVFVIAFPNTKNGFDKEMLPPPPPPPPPPPCTLFLSAEARVSKAPYNYIKAASAGTGASKAPYSYIKAFSAQTRGSIDTITLFSNKSHNCFVLV
jgi:hypothetical protein